MADTQHFCLRWNNYQSSITSAFENLRDDEDFVDVTIACDGKSLKAHRVVLSACSPYFRELLKSTPCKHPVIVLQDVAFADLHALVEFIYHGEVNVHQRNLSSFLKTAEVLRVSGLTQQHASEPPDRDEVYHSDIDTKTFLQSPGLNSRHLFGIDKDGHFASPGSPPLAGPGGATVNQLLRRAAAQAAAIRRERHNSADDGAESKRAKHHHHGASGGGGTGGGGGGGGGGGNSSTDSNHVDASNTGAANTQAAADFSIRRNEDADSPSSQVDGNSNNGVKSEPTDIISTELGADSDPDNSGEEGTGGGSGGGGNGGGTDGTGGDEGGGDSKTSAAAFLHDSKLFQQGQGSYNFTLAALADPALSGLGNQALQAAAGSASEAGGGGAGTSATQAAAAVAAAAASSMSPPQQQQYRMPPPTSGGINEPQECPYCRRTFSCYYSLKRHFQDKHERSDTLYVCEFCQRRYRTKNSLTTHKSLQHRGSSGMLKRLLKNTAIQNVLGAGGGGHNSGAAHIP